MRGEAVLAGFVSQGGYLELAVEFDMLKDGCTVIDEKLRALLTGWGLQPAAGRRIPHRGSGEANHDFHFGSGVPDRLVNTAHSLIANCALRPSFPRRPGGGRRG
jgi:hypothetical protein